MSTKRVRNYAPSVAFLVSLMGSSILLMSCPYLIFCPAFTSNSIFFGPSNISTIVDPKLNSPKASPFSKLISFFNSKSLNVLFQPLLLVVKSY